MDFNDKTDLYLEQSISAPPEIVWRCFTDPELFAQWFAPETITVKDVKYEFRAGGSASLTMVLPDGNAMPLNGCILEVVPARRLVTTDALSAGFRPSEKPFMTAIYDLERTELGTLLKATVLHPTQADKQTHIDMGFYDGWATTFRQLDRLATSLKGTPA